MATSGPIPTKIILFGYIVLCYICHTTSIHKGINICPKKYFEGLGLGKEGIYVCVIREPFLHSGFWAL